MMHIEKRFEQSERGVGVIEALCAITIIAISIAGSISLYLNTVRHLATARTFAGVSSDVESIIEGYRNQTFTQLLAYYNKTNSSITDGETITLTPTTYESKADYTVTFKAIKSLPEATPEALQVDIEANQRGAKSGTLTFNFSTIIAQSE